MTDLALPAISDGDVDALAAWTECDMCDEFICNVHDMHVCDCECPDIDTWVAADLFPYDSPVDEDLRKWVKENPWTEEGDG